MQPTPPPDTTMPFSRHNHNEPEERSDKIALTWTPKHPEKFRSMPDAWTPLIARAKEMQQTLGSGYSDTKFVGPLFNGNGSSWNQLVNGAYRVPTTDTGVKQIEEKLLALVERGKELLIKKAEQKAKPLTLAERFVMRPEYDEVIDCLSDAAENVESGLEERAVIVVGDTRSGKSCLIAKLKAEGKAHWHLRATPDMKRSYKQFLLGIGDALKFRELMDKRKTRSGEIEVIPSESSLQRRIIKKLDKVQGVMVIEELQCFSPSALEFLKMLLNETQVCLLICMLPDQYRRMVRSINEDVKQFLGRSVGVVRLEVTAELVGDFAPKLFERCPHAAELKELIATEAMKGGGMSLLRDVTRDAMLLAPRAGLQRHHVHNALDDFRRKIPAMGRRAA